jgi:hypothetical protein
MWVEFAPEECGAARRKGNQITVIQFAVVLDVRAWCLKELPEYLRRLGGRVATLRRH